MQKMLLATAVAVLTHSAIADDNAIKNALSPFNVTNMEISDSPIAGLKQVVSDQGIFYATEDGKHFLQGTLVEITDKGPVDLTNRPLMKKLESMAPEMIVYPAKNQKHVINVFTDITCPYCMRLHKDMQGYNDRGITVRYLAFPRAGGNSKVAGQMEAIWKSDDPKAAFDAAEKGKIPSAISPDVVQKQYNLGLQFNVTGTPALVLEDGTMLPGYHKPDELIQILEK